MTEIVLPTYTIAAVNEVCNTHICSPVHIESDPLSNKTGATAPRTGPAAGVELLRADQRASLSIRVDALNMQYV